MDSQHPCCSGSARCLSGNAQIGSPADLSNHGALFQLGNTNKNSPHKAGFFIWRPQGDGLTTSLLLPARGETVVTGKGNCTSCHRLGDAGSLGLAPELTAIGATRTAGSLEKSLLDPNSAMIPINRPVRAVLADGTVVNGRRLNEDTYTVQLIDENGRLRSLEKGPLQEFTVIKESPMPSYAQTLTTEEIGDVVAYLLTLQGVEGLD